MALTVEQIIRETRQWSPTQVDELLKALADQSKPAEPSPDDAGNQAVSRVHEFAKKIDAVWEGSGIEISTEEIVNSLRESRSRRE
jgi:hypothetical protein